MNSFCRPLYSRDVAWDFLENVLDVKSDNVSFVSILNKIMDEERLSFDVDDTLKSTIRDPRWRLKEDREKLRKEIVYDMLTKKRLDNDDDVVIGKGGGLPQNDIKARRKHFM